MAKETRTVLIDDLDQEESDDVRTVAFALDGAGYEIELSGPHRDELRDALRPYLDAARPVPAKRRRTRTK